MIDPAFGNFYYCASGSQLFMVEPGNNAPAWSVSVACVSAPSIIHGLELVVVGAADSNIYGFNSTSGEHVWKFATNGQGNYEYVQYCLIFLVKQRGVAFVLQWLQRQ